MRLKTVCIILLLTVCASQGAAASVVQLTKDSALNSYPFWSPDGKEIALSNGDDLYSVTTEEQTKTPASPGFEATGVVASLFVVARLLKRQ